MRVNGYIINTTFLDNLDKGKVLSFKGLVSAHTKVNAVKQRSGTGTTFILLRPILHFDVREVLTMLRHRKAHHYHSGKGFNDNGIIERFEHIKHLCETCEVIPETSDIWIDEHIPKRCEFATRYNVSQRLRKVKAKKLRQLAFLLRWESINWK